MNVEVFEKIFELALTLMFLVITCYVLPYIKAKLSEAEFNQLEEYIKIGVRCAEMYFETSEGAKKKEYVVNYIKGVISNVLNITITDDMLDRMIESAVHNVKYEQGSDNTTTK